ncbi:MAG: winged helix-turn-helix domain-containing protein [Candidatus Acidiferrum sp.]
MERPTATMLRIGAWCVNQTSSQISRDGETARVEVRTMRLLLCLAEHAGEVVSIDDLLDQVWFDVTVAPDSVYQAVTSLRRLLGDDPKQPTYIATVPRLGYRMVATVSPWRDQSVAQTGALTNVHTSAQANAQTGAQTSSSRAADSKYPTTAKSDAPDAPKKSGPRLRAGFRLAVGAALCLALVVAFLFYGKLANNNHSASPAIAPQPQKSIAVLPFLDLTEEMNQEPFADGMTEELIDKLSKIPGLRVPPPTSSFYFKGKLWPRSHGTPQITIADIAKTLGVAYVLDGSVRKSGARLRVDARLIRADNGYVVWSETYDRPFDDILMVQDDIAGEVTKALRASIEDRPDQKGQSPY